MPPTTSASRFFKACENLDEFVRGMDKKLKKLKENLRGPTGVFVVKRALVVTLDSLK